MAEAQVPNPTELSPVTDEYIAQIATKTFTQHLKQFAIILLCLSDAQFDHAVTNAKGEAWSSSYNVSIYGTLCFQNFYCFYVFNWECIYNF